MKEIETKLKLESIEKRLDNIERMLYTSNQSSGNGGLNHELLVMLMEMIRRDARAPAPAPVSTPSFAPAAPACPTPPDATETASDSFEMFRRRTVM